MAASLGESHEHGGAQSSSELNVLFLASEWRSSKGGLSTINRELAINLASHHREVHVTFFVPRCSEEDKKSAHNHKVHLLQAERLAGIDELYWLSSPPDDLLIDVVVGHGVKLSPQAQVIRKHHRCKWVHVVHTAPEELAMHKEYLDAISTGEKKHGTEVELCEMADFVVTIGPKLNEKFCSYLGSCKRDQIVNFTPGIFREFSEVVQVSDREGKFQVLLVGRGDAEDFSLKGFDIAAKAVALLDNTHLIFVGAPEGKQQEVADFFLNCGISITDLTVRTFLESRESLRKVLCEGDLAIMPSRTEGFGLAGLEALSAGLPILVSENSGFGQALTRIRFGSYSLIDSDNAEVWAAEIKKVRDKVRGVRLEESKALRESYEKGYSWEKQSEVLVAKMKTMVRGSSLKCDSTAQQSTSHGVHISTDHAPGTLPVKIAMKGVTFKDGQSGDPNLVMKEMVRRFLATEADNIPPSEWPQSLNLYLKGALHLRELQAKEGSLIISVQCKTLEILERLWDDYRCGHLNAEAEKRLLTDDIKEGLNVESVKLETTILKEDYFICKLFLTHFSQSSQDSTANEEETFPQGQPQVADETDTQSAAGPDPTSLHLTVNCRSDLSHMQFSDEISVAEAFPEYLQNIKVIHASKPADVSEDDSRMRIAVECSSVEILERLWNDYCSGYLNVVAEKCLVTDDIKERFQVERVNLQTTILEEDYLACKEFLLAKTQKEATRIRSTEEKSSQPYGETQIQSPEETGSQTVEEIQSQSAEDTIGKSVKRTFIQVHEESESMIVDGGDITDRGSAEKIPKRTCLQDIQNFDVNRSPQRHIERSLEVFDTTQTRPSTGVYQENFESCEWKLNDAEVLKEFSEAKESLVQEARASGRMAMAQSGFTSRYRELQDLPFPMPRDLSASGLVSPNISITLEYAEQFISLKEYRTAASLFTVVMQDLGNPTDDPPLFANLLCRRAECLLHMNYLQHVMRDCEIAKTLLGGAIDEHIVFLLLRALELQGEIEEAFGYAIIYKALDPKMKRDKDAACRLRAKVMWLCGQGCGHEFRMYRTIDILLLRGEILLSNDSPNLALKMYTEVINLFPAVVEAHEQRARCYFSLGDLSRAKADCNRALNLSQRTSTTAFDTKIKIKIQLGELEEALELANEWRMLDPESIELECIEMEIRDKMEKEQRQRMTRISQSQSMIDLSLGDASCDQEESTNQSVKRVPIRASKQISGAKPKSKKDLQREERQREKERQQIAQELEAKKQERDDRCKKDKTEVPKGDEHAAYEQTAEAGATKHMTPGAPPPLPLELTPAERSRKRKIRRKTRTLRAKREDDDSDASSVCSISTCPGDLNFTRVSSYRPKMPTYPDTDTGAVSDLPKSSFTQVQPSKRQKPSDKQSYGIRPRPSDVHGLYRLCCYYQRKQPCFNGKRCPFAHSEEERKAWEEERKKGKSKSSDRKENPEKEKKSGSSYPSLQEWRRAFRGQYRAPLHIPKKGVKYKMCPDWMEGNCKRGKACNGAHGEKERTAWNEHLKRMEKEIEKEAEEENKQQKDNVEKEVAVVQKDNGWTKKTKVTSTLTNKGLAAKNTKTASYVQSCIKPSVEFRPRPPNVYCTFKICPQIKLGRPCPSGDRCRFAHSEAERRAWEAERKKGSSKPTGGQVTTRKQNASRGSSVLKEFRKAFRSQCRAPLRIPANGQKYRMCPEWTKGACKLGRGCTFAHGDKELEAWNEHLEKMEKEMKTETGKENKEQNDDSLEKTKGSDSPMKDKNCEHAAPTYKLDDLVSSLPGVNVSCEPKDLNVSLQIPLNSEGEILYNWTVQVSYESSDTGHLQDVVLFTQYHKCYTLSCVKFECTVASPNGEPVKVKSPENEVLNDEFHYEVRPHMRSLHGSCEVEIKVSFSTLVFGSFAQVLVLDFGKESSPLGVKMNIEVGSQEFLEEFGEEKSKLDLDWTLWDDGSREIVKFEPKRPAVFNNDKLIDKYKLPKAEDVVPCPLLDKTQGLSPKNYKDVMHQLLFVEEFYIRKQISSFNEQEVQLHVTKLVVKKEEVLCAQEGWLYGSFHVSHPITPDDAQGRLLLRNLFRSLGSVLIAKSKNDSVVYEALVDSVEDSRVILKLSERCCKEVELSNNSFVTVDVQFHINRLPLCEKHDNIDRLGPEHFRILFPELGSDVVEEKIDHLPWILEPKLNEDQKEIIKKIAAPEIDAPPLVVFGPFGTGKTFTLNQAIRRISVNQNNRVLLCTHSNSAADIHVELLDHYLKEQHGIAACRPLRIYTPLRKLATVSDTVKEYCLIADKGTPAEAFGLPTRDDLIRHRVVVTTLGMSRALFDMEFHRGFFSHILIDEAAQALETETLTPLTLAGNNTKVVFTGDHMQMSPDVFSPQAKKWGFQVSLQERLFYDYKRRGDGSKLDPHLILLTENYRSNERVLQFSSDMFYGGDLSSGSDQPLHPQFGPLVFYAALGKEDIDESHASYRNLAEVNEVVKRVKELSDCWPEEWGTKDLKQIAVVSSYSYQVKTIRDGLRKIGLGAVDVETIENIQGKQFRALFVSTVRTFHTCREKLDSGTGESDRPYLYFLSDPKLLNTALTRAQSLIAVVGDPFSLRTVGDCQGLWEEFIKRCSDGGKLFGFEHYELEESISQSGLNVNAAEFVPSGSHDPSAPEQRDLAHSNSSLLLLKGDPNDTKRENASTKARGHLTEKDESEHDSASESEDAGDEMSMSDDLVSADDFAEYEDVDETVPPRHMDPIIQALKEKCEEMKVKRKRKEEAMEAEFGDNAEQKKDETDPLPENATRNSKKLDSNTSRSKIVHEDIKMKTRKGKTQVLLVNIDYKYSERTERLVRSPKVLNQECLQQEYLDRLLRQEPELYRECTLRVTFDKTRTSYGEIQDAESENIVIEGDTRQTFDRDVVVVKLSEKHLSDSTELSGPSEGLKGKIYGVRHHAINLRERQFVCKISRDNPRVMYPINKSMTPIAYLTDESCEGVPIYRKIEPGSDEKAVRMNTLPLKEALSGKFFFVVQYLQWRREFPYPLGIVTKAFRKGNDLPGAFKVLKAEYKLKEEFPGEVSKELERHIKRWSSIPDYERNSRELVKNAFTIDPPRSRALDDALTIEKLENGHCKVGIHIADVSYYVTMGSQIDHEAQRRGTSYFGGNRYGDVLMLPSTLSHDICSLLPNEERRAVSVYLTLDQDGYIQREEELEFCRSIVKSQCRLTYAQAQQVILHKRVVCRDEDGQLTLEIKESIGMLNSLAQKRRKLRLSDGSYFHFDHVDRKEDIEAHELVEEMMILANTAVARYLVRMKADLSPLRIQRPPKTRKINEWRESFGNCARLSLSLGRHLVVSNEVECVEKFFLPTSAWSLISNAHRQQDKRELKLLICNDNIYPQLAVAHSAFCSMQRRAEDVIAAQVEVVDRKHWSLNVREYTRFTSPIRRYLDIVVHRLLLDTVGRELLSDDIAQVYRRCAFLSDNSGKFEKDCARVEAAAELSEGSCEFSAVVEMIEEDFIQLQVLSDFNQFLSQKQRRIRISHLGPIEQPQLDETSGCLELKWKLRIYDASTENIRLAKRSRNLDRHLREDRIRIQALFSVSSSGYHIPSHLWQEVLDAVKSDDDSILSERLKNLDEIIACQREEMSRLRREKEKLKYETFFEASHDDDDDDDDDDGDGDDDDDFDEAIDSHEENKDEEKEGEDETSMHFVETSLVLNVADSVSVQLSANDSGGLMSPEIQLFNLAPGIDVCIEHRKLADKCFSTAASDKASQPTYRSITKYVHLWRPVLEMEAASVAVKNDDTIILQNIEVIWRKGEGGKLFGEFQLNKNFYKTRQIDIFRGDYACVKVRCLTPSSGRLSSFGSLDGKQEFCKEMENEAVAVPACDVVSGNHNENERTSDEGECRESSAGKSYWVGHCIFSLADNSLMKYKLRLFQNSMKVPEGLDNGNGWICTLEIIKQAIPSRRMISTLMRLPEMEQRRGNAPLAHSICLGNALRLPDRTIGLPSDRLSIADHVQGCELRKLNNLQIAAVRQSLRRRFSLIQGPPGTGKTITGVHIAYWFSQINQRDTFRGSSRKETPKQETALKAPPQVLYCGPSNKSVDVVAEYLMKITNIKILRVYGSVIEEEEFPIPNQVKQTRKTNVYVVPQNLKHVALHHVIRDKERSPFAQKLEEFEQKFASMKKAKKKKKKKKKVDDKDVAEYLKLIQEAEKWVIRSVCKGQYHQIVLCTCSAAGSKRVRDGCNNTIQCIVDECGMCLEPETLIPIVWSQAEQVVLIGDHMQLQPIVINRTARSLGLRMSLFERYSNHALMLEEQYRMHEEICEFPSKNFYGNRLQTANSVKEREMRTRISKEFLKFWPSHTETNYVPLVFCNVVGKEEELVVTTKEGNERSKSNLKEKSKVVEVIKKLLGCGVNKNQIVVLSPYRAQCHIIGEDLAEQQLSEIPVMSIVQSQGSESDFVIISLVRSLPQSQIDHEPSGGWLREKLGFLTDEHQINVALTRAKKGLCIIGNKNLIGVYEMWSNLIEDYQKKSCIVESAHWPVP